MVYEFYGIWSVKVEWYYRVVMITFKPHIGLVRTDARTEMRIYITLCTIKRKSKEEQGQCNGSIMQKISRIVSVEII
jgi:hypothetical protein